MSTQQDTIAFILEKLGEGFTARAMFGEYALYADGKVVGLVCDDQLYVKIVPASSALADVCEQAPPYSGAKPHYLVEEHLLTQMLELPQILRAVAASLPKPKKRLVKKSGSARNRKRAL
jgi:TfoX/Sxy family transcriptional regulator of competence genes